ncbi:MAG: hypothetical protein ACRD6W_08585 [Nitrososphaerales archaeon]
MGSKLAQAQRLEWEPSTYDAFVWMATSTVGLPDTTEEWRRFARATIALAQGEAAIIGLCVEGFEVPIYEGHLIYKAEVYSAPTLFQPCWPPHVVVFADDIVHVFVDNTWHCGARRVETVDADGAEAWIVAAETFLGARDTGVGFEPWLYARW